MLQSRSNDQYFGLSSSMLGTKSFDTKLQDIPDVSAGSASWSSEICGAGVPNTKRCLKCSLFVCRSLSALTGPEWLRIIATKTSRRK